MIIAKVFSISRSVCERESHPLNHFSFILLGGLLQAGDKNITNCLAGARGTVESEEVTASYNPDESWLLSREAACCPERMLGWCLQVLRQGAQPGASCFNGSLLSCGKRQSNPYCLGGELCLLISLYFKVLQQLGSFTIELRTFSFHLLPHHIKMKGTVLTGAKRKMEAILEKKKNKS